MDLESTSYPPMLVLVILEIGYAFEDLNELLPLVPLLIQLPDVLGGELSVKRHTQHGLDSAEPGGDDRNERNFHAGSKWEKRGKVPSGFAFVDVVRE